MKVLLKNFIKILFFINLITRTTQTCALKYYDKNWLDEWRVILYQDDRNEYQLFRGDNVAANTKIFLLCNRKTNPITVHCMNNNQFDVNLPLQNKCKESDSLIPTSIESQVTYCDYTLYEIGFHVKICSDIVFVPAYQVCFDKKHLRTVFTINKAYPVGGNRPNFQFNPDNFFNGHLFFALSRKSAYERFKKLLGDKQTYMSFTNDDHLIDRGHLTPSADFTLINLKRSTFNMVNAFAQFKTINNGNCKRIEEWVRDPSRTPANVCTGVLDCDLDARNVADMDCVVKLRDGKGNLVPMFMANRKIPIPLWIYKTVRFNGNALVFLTLNNIYHKGVVQAPTDICEQIPCPLKLSQTVKEGWTFCCKYYEFMEKHLPLLLTVC